MWKLPISSFSLGHVLVVSLGPDLSPSQPSLETLNHLFPEHLTLLRRWSYWDLFCFCALLLVSLALFGFQKTHRPVEYSLLVYVLLSDTLAVNFCLMQHSLQIWPLHRWSYLDLHMLVSYHALLFYVGPLLLVITRWPHTPHALLYCWGVQGIGELVWEHVFYSDLQRRKQLQDVQVFSHQ